MAHDVFISYATAEKPIADAMCATLEGAGIRTLRLGQRVKFSVTDESGAKVARSLRIVTVD